MIRALREVEGGLRLLMNVWLRMPALARAPVRESFLRQVYFTGVTASTGVVLRASGLGALIIAFTMQVLDADTALAVKILLWVVLRGFGFHPPYAATYLAGVLIVMVSSVPALPGGTGVAEVAALALLTPLAPGLSPAFLVAWRGMTYYVDLALGAAVAGVLARKPVRTAAPAFA